MPDDMEKNLKSYIKFGESVKISPPVSCLGAVFREAAIRKKVLGAFSDESYLYIDENGAPVYDAAVIKNAAELTFYYDIFFGDSGKSLKAALRSEEEEVRDKLKYEGIMSALDFLTNEKDKDSQAVKNIMIKFPEIRKRNNEMIKEITDSMELIKNSGEIFSDKNLRQLYPRYLAAMKANFESIKYIEKGKAYYSDLKGRVDKKRRKYTIKWNRKLSVPMFDLSYELGYYIKLLNTYNSVLSMNPVQYTKFLEKSMKENSAYKINRIRK